MGRPLTFDHLQSKKKPTIRKVQIVLDDEPIEAVQLAQDELEIAIRQQGIDFDGGAERVKAAEESLEKAKKAADAAVVTFKFRSIGRKKYDALVAEHPPLDSHREKVREAGGDPDLLLWNPDTFPLALVKLSIIQPELTGEQVDALWESDDWGPEELATLEVAALDANTSRTIHEVGKG